MVREHDPVLWEQLVNAHLKDVYKQLGFTEAESTPLDVRQMKTQYQKLAALQQKLNAEMASLVERMGD